MEQQPYNPGCQQSYDPNYYLPPEQNPYYKKSERRNLSRIGAAFSGYLILVTVVQLTMMTVCNWISPAFAKTEGFTWMLQIIPGYLIGFPLFWVFVSGMPKKTPEKKKLGAANWISFLAIAFCLMMAGSYIANGLMAVIETVRGAEISNAVFEQLSASSPLMNLIVVVIFAPIVEELMCHKLVVDRLLPYSEWLAVLTGGLIFGLLHGNFYQFFYAAFLGILFSYVYVKTGHILHTIIMHMIINFTGSIISVYLTKMSSDLVSAPTSINPWDVIAGIYSMAMMALAICGLILLINKLKKPDLKKTGDRLLTLPTQFKLTWINAGSIVYCVICLMMFVSSLFI